MEVYVVIGWNSYTGDFMDEQEILGGFHSLESANKYKEEYLNKKSREYDDVNIEMYIVQ